MARGRKIDLTIALTLPERAELLHWQRSPAIPAALSRRARLILLRTDGATITTIEQRVGIGRRHIYKWLYRFQVERLDGLMDLPGRGGWRSLART